MIRMMVAYMKCWIIRMTRAYKTRMDDAGPSVSSGAGRGDSDVINSFTLHLTSLPHSSVYSHIIIIITLCYFYNFLIINIFQQWHRVNCKLNFFTL
jgi:hypothetical protein